MGKVEEARRIRENFTTVSLRQKVSDVIDDLVKPDSPERLLLPSGSPKYRSKADFVNVACERLIAEEKAAKVKVIVVDNQGREMA